MVSDCSRVAYNVPLAKSQKVPAYATKAIEPNEALSESVLGILFRFLPLSVKT